MLHGLPKPIVSSGAFPNKVAKVLAKFCPVAKKEASYHDLVGGSYCLRYILLRFLWKANKC